MKELSMPPVSVSAHDMTVSLRDFENVVCEHRVLVMQYGQV